MSQLPSVQACGRSVRADAGAASLMLSAEGRAGWSGLNLCSSVSACPCCSARIREHRAAQIQAAGLAQLRRGGHLAFLTLTMPHDADDQLAALLAALRRAWKAMRKDNGYRDMVAATGLRFVRAWEVTYTAGRIGGHGWHPHLHVLLFLDVEPTPDRLRAIHAAMTGPWVASIVADGYRRPTQTDLQAVEGRTGAAGLVKYLVKVQDGLDRAAAAGPAGGWQLGREMARADLKRGKRKRSRTPFELLEGAVGLTPAGGRARGGPNWTDASRWHEYEAATKGLRVIEASRGLFADLAVDEVLVEDAPEHGTAAAVEVAQVPYDLWPAVVRFSCAARLLTAAERGGQPAVEAVLRALRRRITYEDARAVRTRAAIVRVQEARSTLPARTLAEYVAARAAA